MLALASLCSILFFGWLGHATDVLFLSTLTGAELSLVQGESLTFKILDPSEWAFKDTNYFKSFGAIIIGDPNSNDVSWLDPLVSSRTAWSPAIKGNAIVIGSDPAGHRPRSDQLMLNGIRFAIAGEGTGLYITLSEYYEFSSLTTLAVMQEFGKFTVRGADCYDAAHIVGSNHAALTSLTDAVLSNWQCSVHEVFAEYPKEFKPLAIALNATGDGARKFPDSSSGVPYILATNITIGCDICLPYPGQNLCHPTTSCTPTPYGTMCLTRPGYKADDVANDDVTLQWRMKWPVPGHEHRVAVAPGTSANTLCDPKNVGPDVCKEVAVADCSAVVPEDRRFESAHYDTDQQAIHEGEL